MAFGKPSATSCSSYSTCRCRLLSSRKSRSTIRTKPTPARTSVSATTEPNAPHPQTSARALPNCRWPSSPKRREARLAIVSGCRDVRSLLTFIRCRGRNRRAAAAPVAAGRSCHDTRRSRRSPCTRLDVDLIQMRHLGRPHARIGHDGFGLYAVAIAEVAKLKLGGQRAAFLAKRPAQCAAQHNIACQRHDSARSHVLPRRSHRPQRFQYREAIVHILTQRREAQRRDDFISSLRLCAFA